VAAKPINFMNDSPAIRRLDFFERYLSLWVLACMVAGVAQGKVLPGLVPQVSQLEFGKSSHVNIAIAVLIWLMIYPMMLKFDFGGIKGVFARPKGLFITLIVNWLIKPFSMTLLGWVFIRVVFSKRRRARPWFLSGVISPMATVLTHWPRSRSMT